MTPVTIGNATLYCGDAREILPALTFDAVVVDPPWDQAKGIPGADDPRGLFADVTEQLARARIVCVQLGSYTDPCFCAPLAARMKFIHTCWLRYVPPSYNGRVLVEADVAYVYGTPPKSAPGRRVLPASVASFAREPNEREFLKNHGRNRTSAQAAETLATQRHPMPRHTKHVRWLIEWHAERSDVVCDPFMGSGTTGVACATLNQPFVGIEVKREFFDLACERIDQAQRQARLFA